MLRAELVDDDAFERKAACLQRRYRLCAESAVFPGEERKARALLNEDWLLVAILGAVAGGAALRGELLRNWLCMEATTSPPGCMWAGTFLAALPRLYS